MTSLSKQLDFTPQLTNLQAALEYAALGWHVLPLNGKIPHRLVPHGQKEATTDLDIITNWFEQVPYANIGIYLKPSRLCAIDVDVVKYNSDRTTTSKQGGETFAALELQYGKITSDVEAITGSGGRHLVFSVADEKLAQVGDKLVGSLGTDIDLKFDGYIVVSPSTHLSGNQYQWIDGKNPLQDATPSSLPDWVYWFKKPALVRSSNTVSLLTKSTDADIGRARLALCFVHADNRECWLKIGMALHSTGHPKAFEAWDEWSQSCPEKYDHKNCERVWESLSSDRGITLATLFHYFQEYCATDAVQDIARRIVREAIASYCGQSMVTDPVELNTPKVMLAALILKHFVDYAWREVRETIKKLRPSFSITEYEDKLRNSDLISLFPNVVPEKKEKENAKLLRLATEQCEFVHNADKVAYAIMQVDGIYQCWSVRSADFQEWLSHAYYKENNLSPSTNVLKQTIETLVGMGKYEGREIEVHTRTAKGADGAYYLDLCNDKWQVVRVTYTGWDVLESTDSPVFFTRNGNMRPLPIPISTGRDLSVLWDFVNAPQTDRDLVLAWLLECLRPDTQYPVMTLSGGQGTGKSFSHNRLRNLIDPSKVNLRGSPKRIEDIHVSARNNLCVSYENLSYLSPEEQDVFCTLATGGGSGGRELYTNAGEFTVQLKNPVILNGINIVVTRPDLLSRTILVRLPNLSKNTPETELNQRWDVLYPSLLGSLLDLFSKTLANLPQAKEILKDETLPRMADFTMLGTAMYLANSNKQPKDFLKEYTAKRTVAIQDNLETDPTARAVLGYLEANPNGYEGFLGDLWQELRLFSSFSNFPRSVQGFTHAIQRLAQDLEQLDIVLEKINRTKKGTLYRLKRSETKNKV